MQSSRLSVPAVIARLHWSHSKSGKESKPSKLELPCLADQVVTKKGMRRRVNEIEPVPFIDPSRRCENVVRPKRNRAIVGFASELDACNHESIPDAKPARRRLDKQSAQLCDTLALLMTHHKHRTDFFSAPLRYPAPVVLGGAMRDEIGNDPGYDSFEAVIPSVLSGIEISVTRNDPPEVTCPRRTKSE